MDEQNEPKESLQLLEHQHEYFAKLNKFSVDRKARCEQLMKRKIAKKWPPDKVAKMARRLLAASQLTEQSASAIDQLEQRIERLRS